MRRQRVRFSCGQYAALAGLDWLFRRVGVQNLGRSGQYHFAHHHRWLEQEDRSAKANRWHVTATARVANNGMEWNERHTSLAAWGKPPTCVEPVTGELA